MYRYHWTCPALQTGLLATLGPDGLTDWCRSHDYQVRSTTSIAVFILMITVTSAMTSKRSGSTSTIPYPTTSSPTANSGTSPLSHSSPSSAAYLPASVPTSSSSASIIHASGARPSQPPSLLSPKSPLFASKTPTTFGWYPDSPAWLTASCSVSSLRLSLTRLVLMASLLIGDL
jgi:hypothetical protein